MPKTKNIVIENAKIVFRNFAGKEDTYNPAGRRMFGVLIDPDVADDLVEEGWHIKWLKPREEGEERQPYLPVRVSFKVSPPAIYVVTKRNKTALTESNVATLDNAEFSHIDLQISPYHWGMPNGEHGITAYLKCGYFTIVEDPFYERYANLNEPGVSRNDEEIEIPFE